MMWRSGVGLGSYVSGNIFATGKAVSAWLMFSLELGMLLLAIVGLFMPRLCSGLLERAATWGSIWIRRLEERIVIRLWACRDAGHRHVVGQEVVECGLRQAREKTGEKGYINQDIYRVKRWTTAPSIRWAMKILARSSRK